MALTQRAIVKSRIAVTKVVNEVLGLAGARGNLVKGCTDTLAILGHASRDNASVSEQTHSENLRRKHPDDENCLVTTYPPL